MAQASISKAVVLYSYLAEDERCAAIAGLPEGLTAVECGQAIAEIGTRIIGSLKAHNC